jgi:glycine betaine/proline transport system substrate-binding protein
VNKPITVRYIRTNVTGDAQTVRAAANTYDMQVFEGWYVPDYLAEQYPDLTGAAGLATSPAFDTAEGPARFISCPPDWGCAIINRHLLTALELEGRFEVVGPAPPRANERPDGAGG